MNKLTSQQENVLNFLKTHIKENGYPPSVREICEGLKLSSTSTIHAHLSNLEKKGYIQKSKSKNRSIEILEDDFYDSDYSKEYIDVPIIGTVAAGEPILATENIEGTFPIPVHMGRNKDLFMLRIKGDSMINAGIFQDDLVLVRKQQNAVNKDIVVALIEESATVKTFYKEKSHFRLQPENDSYQPIITKDLLILGKVIGLFRNY